MPSSRLPEFQNSRIASSLALVRHVLTLLLFMTTFRIHSLVDLLANLFEDSLS